MSSDDAEDEVKSRVRSLQRRGEIAGSSWNDLDPELRRWLRSKARSYADGGDDPDDAARRAIRRAEREGKLPRP